MLFFFQKCNAFKFTVFNIETKSKQFMLNNFAIRFLCWYPRTHTHTHTLRVSLPKANQVWIKRGPISFINQFFSVRLMAKTVCKWPLINYIKQSYFNLLPSFRRCQQLRTAGHNSPIKTCCYLIETNLRYVYSFLLFKIL